VAVKIADTSDEMEQRKELLMNHAVVITEEGPMGIQSRDEVKNIIFSQFGIPKHEYYVDRSYQELFIAIFLESHNRDVLLAAGRAVEGTIELCFHAWDLYRFGDRENLPYHVRISMEGIPQHAWCKEIVDKVLYNEAIIHHVEEETLDRVDQQVFKCCAFSKDPSRMPQVDYLTLTHPEQGGRRNAQTHFNRPRAVRKSHVFRVFIHIDVVAP
jgi:hypothetical protein